MSETWLSKSVSDNEVRVDGYRTYRKDRGGNGGGVLVYVSETLKSCRRVDLEKDDVEAVWIELRFQMKEVLCCNIYRPPGANHELMESIYSMTELVVQEGKEVVIAGDFNCNLLHPKSVVQDLLATAVECNLKQLVTEPTRVTDRTETMIDLLFSSHPHLFLNVV